MGAGCLLAVAVALVGPASLHGSPADLRSGAPTGDTLSRAHSTAAGGHGTAVTAAPAAAAGAQGTDPVASDSAGGTWSPQPAVYAEGTRLDQPVVMSDGTVIRADVYYPTVPATKQAAPGPFPVLLQQTPYGKQNISSDSTLANTDVGYFVDRGYIVVISDVRGTGDSGGTWGLFDPVQDTDGATLVNWAARLPDADGKVGLFGESYMGINQFLTVSALGPDSPVKAMFPIISGNDLYRDTVTQGGLLDAEFSSFYLALVGGLNAANPVLDPAEYAGEGDTTDISQAPGILAPTELVHSESLLQYDLPSVLSIETGGDQAYDQSY
ncbi:MAG: CocE/NonD family hydrolase, partial [Acidimicrobiales bacterium]